jgi:cell division protein ZapA
MTKDSINTTIEILGKPYPIRCVESELPALQKAAEYLNQQMTEVQSSGKVINLERIAIITALNMAHQYLQLEQKNHTLIAKVNQRICSLQEKLDATINKSFQMELGYSTESAKD